MKRYEILKALEEINEYSDADIAINAEYIRSIAIEAYSHIKQRNDAKKKIDSLKKQLAEKDEKARFADMVLKKGIEEAIVICRNNVYRFESCTYLECNERNICKARAELLKKYPPHGE